MADDSEAESSGMSWPVKCRQWPAGGEGNAWPMGSRSMAEGTHGQGLDGNGCGRGGQRMNGELTGQAGRSGLGMGRRRQGFGKDSF